MRRQRPQEARNPVESELALVLAAMEKSLGRQVHGPAFGECSGTAISDDQPPDRHLRDDGTCRYVRGYNHLVLMAGRFLL